MMYLENDRYYVADIDRNKVDLTISFSYWDGAMREAIRRGMPPHDTVTGREVLAAPDNWEFDYQREDSDASS